MHGENLKLSALCYTENG